jgi:hypothetical protein
MRAYVIDPSTDRFCIVVLDNSSNLLGAAMSLFHAMTASYALKTIADLVPTGELQDV